MVLVSHFLMVVPVLSLSFVAPSRHVTWTEMGLCNHVVNAYVFYHIQLMYISYLIKIQLFSLCSWVRTSMVQEILVLWSCVRYISGHVVRKTFFSAYIKIYMVCLCQKDSPLEFTGFVVTFTYWFLSLESQSSFSEFFPSSQWWNERYPFFW